MARLHIIASSRPGCIHADENRLGRARDALAGVVDLLDAADPAAPEPLDRTRHAAALLGLILDELDAARRLPRARA